VLLSWAADTLQMLFYGAVQPGEEKAAGRPYGSLPVPEGEL